MSNVILHLGLAKTGTSWLQQQVFPRMDVTFHHCRHYDILDKPIDGTTIFSFEGFSGAPMNNNRYILAYRLHKLFPHAKIIVGFRDKTDYLFSLYSQYLKGGGIKDYLAFYSWIDFSTFFLNWDIYKKHLIRLWGEDYCYFYEFEDMKKDPKMFLNILERFIGKSFLSHPSFKKINKKLTFHQMGVWLFFNKYFRSRWNTDALFPRWMNPCVWWWLIEKRC